MEHYVALDVSLKEIAVCIIDSKGETQRGAPPAGDSFGWSLPYSSLHSHR